MTGPSGRPRPAHGLAGEAEEHVVGAGLLVAADLGRRVDQRHVGEGLGEVSDQSTGHRVVLLGQQAQVVAQVEQAIEELAGIVLAAEQGQAVGQPERAGQERPLAAGQPVDVAGVDGPVAEDEVTLHQLPLDGLDGGPHPGVRGREEPHQGDHQQAGVQLVRAVVLGEAPLSTLNPWSHTWSWISWRMARQRSTGPSVPYSSTVRMARSMATHAITLEWVKWRRGPRTSQIPSSGSRQPVSRNSISASCSSQAGPLSGSSGCTDS